MASIALVVVEPGSDWPPFVRGGAHDVIALSQANVDLDSGALRRACQRAAHSRAGVRLAVLACGSGVDDASIHRRAFTASRLLAAVAPTLGGQLVLSASRGSCAALRLGLIGLASTLSTAATTSLAGVSVRVGYEIIWLDARPLVARLGAALRCASYSHNAWQLDMAGSGGTHKGRNYGRKALPS
jgi:hypothetical protein